VVGLSLIIPAHVTDDDGDQGVGEPLKNVGRRLPWWARRIFGAVLTLVAVSLLIFVATQVLPGDAALAILGKEATPERLAELRAELGLDRPLVVQYLDWARGFVTGDLGTSLVSHLSVADELKTRALNSLALVIAAIAITLPLSVVLGVYTAARRDRFADNVTSGLMLVMNSLPEFVIALLLIVFLSTMVTHLLPSVSLFPAEDTAFNHPRAIILPVLTLVFATSPYLTRLVRASMIDELESEYVTMSRLKGVPEFRVVVRHALRNSLVPLIQGTALILAYLAGGIVIVEYIFRFPGLGGLLLESVSARDLPVIQATALLLAAVYVLANLSADLLSVAVTPRLRHGAGL